MKTKVWLTALSGVAGLAAAFSYLPRDVSTSATGERLLMNAGPDARWIHGVGRVEPESEVRRLIFRTYGIIDQCRVEAGATVKKGDVLMTLKSEEAACEVAVAEMELQLAEAEREKVLAGVNPFRITAAESEVDVVKEQLRHLKKEDERSLRMFGKAAVSESESEQARTALVQQGAALRRAEATRQYLTNFVTTEDRQLAATKVRLASARLELKRQRYRDTVLVAPDDGTVLEVLKREGEGVFLIDGEPVMIFGNLARLRIRAEIDERYVRAVRVGQRCVAFGRGLGKESFPGKVIAVRDVMGKRTMFSKAATERKDLDVVQVVMEMEEGFRAPVWLQVDVKVDIE
jgi:multidrug resistance efflux pump